MLTPNKVKKEKMLWKTYVFVFDKDFFYDCCLAKNSSLWSIPNFNHLTIKENFEEETCWGHSYLTLQVPIPQNGQTYSNNRLQFANELFECVWSFCEIGA